MKPTIFCSQLNPTLDVVQSKSNKIQAKKYGYDYVPGFSTAQMFPLWHKTSYIIHTNSYCIIKDIDTTIIQDFLNSDKNILLSSIEDLPLSFDVFIIKTNAWSKIFLLDYFQSQAYIKEYIQHNTTISIDNIKQIKTDPRLRAFSNSETQHMIYNSIQNPLASCLSLSDNFHNYLKKK